MIAGSMLVKTLSGACGTHAGTCGTYSCDTAMPRERPSETNPDGAIAALADHLASAPQNLIISSAMLYLTHGDKGEFLHLPVLLRHW